MMVSDFKHKMGAHCESGTVTGLLNHANLEISEPLVFGIAGGIFFGYFHRMKSFPFPTFIVRNRPGKIRTNFAKRTGVRFATKNFREAAAGMDALDALLAKGIPTACQVDFFYMDYVPSWERVHINVHFLTVLGKEENQYHISDAYFPKPVLLDAASLQKGRFASGSMSPKGFLFYPEHVPVYIDYETAIRKGIKKACFNMLKIPIPFLGVKGIRKFADKVVEWPKLARDTEHLSHEIMKINILLEDQGTGGAGFRFMYATFLQQAASIIQLPELQERSRELMLIGDGWREISLFSARIGKNRDLGPERLKELSGMIRERADVEEKFFRKLAETIK